MWKRLRAANRSRTKSGSLNRRSGALFRMPEQREIALVLGGGGPLGLIWMTELLLGWASAWAEKSADPLAPLANGRIVGTSAGSIVGACLAVHGSLESLAAREADPSGPGTAKRLNILRFVWAFLKARVFTRSTNDFRRSLGRSALRAALPGERDWIGFIAEFFPPGAHWPRDREFIATVVDAHTGKFAAWNRSSGVTLPVAVAASCAMPCTFPLVHTLGRVWMDGGIGSTTNALLARGCGRVVILDPLGRSLAANTQLGQEIAALEAGGAHALALQPDVAVRRAIGPNFFDMRRRPQVTAAARAQAQATANAAWSLLADG